MPGGGLTAIGLAGLVTSYGGIAHTFIDGMHALTGLLFFIGLIFLGAGILDGGVSTSNRTKATVLVIISIVLGFGAAGFIGSTSTTLPTLSGILILIAVPAIIIPYVAVKMPQYVRPIGIIVTLAVCIGITSFFAFGVFGPSEYLISDVVEETVEDIADVIQPTSPIFAITILNGSAEQGNPDYGPDNAFVESGYVVEWTNEDEVMHTVTSSIDFGETFDSGIMDPGNTFQIDTANLALGEYEYMCIVHPWMVATFVIEESRGPVTEYVNIPVGADNNVKGQTFYDPQEISVTKGTSVVWNNEDEVMHTVTSSIDFGEMFDSGIIDPGNTFQIDTANLALGEYEYMCIVHPWMIGSVNVG
jgi:plastocyanin